MKALVTGGAGFIGSNLTEALLTEGHDVCVVDDFSTGRRSNLASAESWAAAGGGRYRLLEGDIRDPGVCNEGIEGRDHVFHLAAIPSVPRSVADPMTTNAVNLEATLRLLEAARRAQVERFVFSSSSSVYGESEVLPKVESMPPAPISPYGLQKLTAESYCALYHRLYGLPTVALRYFNVFGPRQDPGSEYAAVVPKFLTAIKAGRRPTIYGDGEQTRDFTFVANVVRVNLLACNAGSQALGRAFNVGCGTRISLNDLVREIAALVGCEVEPEYTDPRPGDIRHSLAGLELTRTLLGYEPDTGLTEGLRRTLDSF